MSDDKLSELAYSLGVYDSYTEKDGFLGSLHNLKHFDYKFYEIIELSVTNLDTETRKLIATGVGVLSIKGRELTVTRNLADSFEIQH